MVPLWNCGESGIRIGRLTDHEEVEELVRVFEGIAEAEGWKPEGALRQCLARSTHFAAFTENKIVGGLQLVRPDGQGDLPCNALWPEVETDPAGRCAHIAILAVEPSFRGRSELFWSLGVEMWRFCVIEGVSTLFIEVTPRVLPVYRRLGWPLEVKGGRRVHWGEDCHLCSLGIAEVAQTLLRRSEHSAYYRRIVGQAFRMQFPPDPGLAPDEARAACLAF